MSAVSCKFQICVRKSLSGTRLFQQSGSGGGDTLILEQYYVSYNVETKIRSHAALLFWTKTQHGVLLNIVKFLTFYPLAEPCNDGIKRTAQTNVHELKHSYQSSSFSVISSTFKYLQVAIIGKLDRFIPMLMMSTSNHLLNTQERLCFQ